MIQKVVAHFIDHQIVKGTSVDVDPSRPRCHINTDDRGLMEVDLDQVKALYFVKDLGGNAAYDEAQAPSAGDSRLRGSTLIDITFLDGEHLGALTNRYPPRGRLFFVVPMDPQSNNQRILINGDAVAEMKVVEAPPAPKPSASAQQVPRTQRTSWVFDGKDIKYTHPGR